MYLWNTKIKINETWLERIRTPTIHVIMLHWDSSCSIMIHLHKVVDTIMDYTAAYQSPFGSMLLAADEIGLKGLWFDGGKYYAEHLNPEHEEKDLPVFDITKKWLDIYFSGQEPNFMPPIHMTGSPFQLSVWKLLQQIPYGKTTTYGQLAKTIAQEMGLSQMSAQAIGGAVGHNKISIIIPCHRVVGSNGNLTGYAGGLDKKQQLLALEGVDMKKLFMPALHK